MKTTQNNTTITANKGYVNVYVANLGAYTRSELVGEWLSLPMDQEELTLEIKKILGNDEEYAIHDYESDLGLEISEYENIYELNETLQMVEEYQVDEIKAIINCYGASLEEALKMVNDRHFIYLDKETCISENENLAYSYVESLGSLECAVGDKVSDYFDYESFGRDLRFDLDMILEDMEEEEREEYHNMSDEKLGEWYIFELLGGVEELGKETLERYFDYESFGRDLQFDYSIDQDTMIAVSDY